MTQRGASAAERIVVVDGLRGFALAGILAANSLYWSGWDFMSEAQAAARFGAGPTRALSFWHKFLIDGKSYTIFSLLFGLGFALQLARLEARGADGLRVFRRRLLMLLGIGLVHLVLVWDRVFRIEMLLENWRLPKVFGTMLLGMWAGRRLVAGTLLGDRRLLWGVLAAGLAIGLPASWLYATTPNSGQNSWGSMIGTAPLGFVYAGGFVLAWPHAQAVLGWLAAPGRMALTNYLAQSLLGSAVYLGVGLGLAGRASPMTVYAIAAAIFAAQVLWSHLWLARFAQGPMEWMWRRLTYAGARG